MIDIIQLREKFNKVLAHINREGIPELVSWLETTDFFTAPASTAYHNNFPGGLLSHSINVTEFAIINFNHIIKYKPELETLKESVILCALFHDLCKCNVYKSIQKWTKDVDNKWKSYNGYEFKDDFPAGHGSKSVILLNRYIKLTDVEILAIMYHMGAFDVGQSICNYAKMGFDKASEHPLVKIIYNADSLATVLENTVDHKLQAS